MPRSQAEFRLQCLVRDLLALHKLPWVHAFAVPNGEARSARTGARLKRMGVRAGEPDIIILTQGRCFGLELKAAGGRLSAEQRQVQAEWREAGSVYFVASGWDEALHFLASIPAIKPMTDGTRFAPRQPAEAA